MSREERKGAHNTYINTEVNQSNNSIILREMIRENKEREMNEEKEREVTFHNQSVIPPNNILQRETHNSYLS